MSRVFSFSYSFCIVTFYFFLFINFIPDKIHARLPFDLVFVQVPAQNTSGSNDSLRGYTPLDRYIEGTRIVKLSTVSDHALNLTPDFYSAADPDISFDGSSIIFAGKKERTDYWQIWRMKIDGSQKTQITNVKGDCLMPVHAGSRFYLNDPQPTPQIIYAGTAHNWRNLKEKWPVLSLYGTDPAGKEIHRLTFNLYSDFSPDVLPDGRIVFSSWQESQIRRNYALMAINNDGTDLLSYYESNDSSLNKMMTHVSYNEGIVYFIESDHLYWLGGGNIGAVSQRRPQHSHRIVSRGGNGLYHSPCPVPEGGLLSSFRKRSNQDVYSIYRVDPVSGEREDLLFREEGWHSIDAQIPAVHPKAKGRSNWLIPGSVTGVFYCLDSYQSNLSQIKKIKSGSIKHLRVLEGLPLSEEDCRTFATSEYTLEENKSITPRRILGIAPVEEDGSFQIRVPAEIPINFQLLDENYISLSRQDTWTWVIGNENRGCIGCHEDREMSPPNILIEAVTKPAVDLSASPDQWKTVDFQHQISPIIHLKCATANCHISGKIFPDLSKDENPDSLSSLRSIYDRLLRKGNGTEEKQYIYPGNTRKSPLLEHLMGVQDCFKNLSPVQRIKPLPPGEQLTHEETILFLDWIDTGAFWNLSVFKMQKSHEN